MTDQEKVKSWLEGLSQDDWRQFHSDSEVSNIAKAALTLLKEKEVVKTKIDAFGHPYCPKCKILVYETWEFCPHCGQAVKMK